jgi:adenylate cyclase
MEREDAAADVITFPGHRLGTIGQTMAGFRGASAASHAHRRRDRVTVVEADLRGYDRVAAAVDRAGADHLVRAAGERAIEAVNAFAPQAVSLSGDHTTPIVSATFAGPAHCRRAVRAAIALRDAVEAAANPAGLRACVGVDSGEVVEASAAGLTFSSVGTVRMFAGRLREFAGPGQVLLSAGVWAEVEGSFQVRSVGEVRTNAGGETREAFCIIGAPAGARALPV